MTVQADQREWRLFHFALCPYCRKIRLLLSEKRIAAELINIPPWEPQPVYPRHGHSKLVPVLKDNRGLVLADSWVICEFIEETMPVPSLMIGSPEQRAEVRRLVAWADDCLYAPVTLPLQIAAFDAELRPVRTNSAMIGVAAECADMFIDEIAYLLDRRGWLAGPALSLADLAIAAHLSVLDYFGAVNWTVTAKRKLGIRS